MYKKLSLLTLVSLLNLNIAMAAGNFEYTPTQTTPQYNSGYYQQDNYSPKNNTLKGRVVTVPAGVNIAAVTSAPLSSEYLGTGSAVSVNLGSDFYYGGQLIAPAGSTVVGTVTSVKKAGHATVNGYLGLRFTEIVTPYGTRIPISARIKTDDGTGILKAATKKDSAKEYAKDMTVGAGAGALTGLVASAISGGAIGKGTAIMTGVGAGAGLAKSLWDKGVDVEIPSGSRIQLQIDQPITVSPSANSYDY